MYQLYHSLPGASLPSLHPHPKSQYGDNKFAACLMLTWLCLSPISSKVEIITRGSTNQSIPLSSICGEHSGLNPLEHFRVWRSFCSPGATLQEDIFSCNKGRKDGRQGSYTPWVEIPSSLECPNRSKAIYFSSETVHRYSFKKHHMVFANILQKTCISKKEIH